MGSSHSINFEETKLMVKEKMYFPQTIREAIEVTENTDNCNTKDGYHLSNT
jgi:hypothetical protein